MKRDLRESLARRLLGHCPSLAQVTIGFDGFVDEIINVVAKRSTAEKFICVDTIRHFGEMICQAGGHSCLREIMIRATHPGGCAINMGDGLAALGVPVHAFATLGAPVHPAFTEPLSRFALVRSWGDEPGRTLAFEFEDGKLMFSYVAHLAEFTADHVTTLLSDGCFAASCSSSRVIALTNWSLYPRMTEVWQLLVKNVFSTLPHSPAFFVDLVDPSGRSEDDILEMLHTLRSIEQCGPVCLGLNANEAKLLAALLCADPQLGDAAGPLDLAAQLQSVLGLREVVIHSARCAILARNNETHQLRGPYCAQPKRTTGAGDRFNAGYTLGLLLDLPADERLLCATAVSGFFVREARSPTIEELATFLRHEIWPEDLTDC